MSTPVARRDRAPSPQLVPAPVPGSRAGRPERPASVIALVSSAGGLRAMTAVLEALPADLSAAVLALQHQEPRRPSRLAAILGRCTALAVRDAHDGDRLEPGHVFVVPPGRHALIDSTWTIRLVRTDGYPPPRPSADILLCTLATAVMTRAIAVVLSGSGHDGAIGVQAIDACGGTVLVQEVDAESHAGMPEAALHANRPLPPIALDALGSRLVELVTGIDGDTATAS